MFSRIRNFFDRHKGKFLVTGGIVGGLYILSYYAERKLMAWHNTEAQKTIEKQKRKQHFEGTKETAISTVLSMSSAITEVLARELDNEGLIRDIRNHPENKHLLWEQLKIVGFSRCISSIFISSLVTLVVNSHLMILGAHTYGDIKKSKNSECEISAKLQHRYLKNIQYLVEEGLPLLIKRIFKASSIVLKNIPLTEQLTLEQLEGVLKDIILVLSGETLTDSEHNCNISLKLSPWSQYVVRMDLSFCEDAEDDILRDMMMETTDILDSKDFLFLMENEVNLGLNHILDYIVDRYPEPIVNVMLDVTCNGIEDHVGQINGDCSVEDTCSDISIENISQLKEKSRTKLGKFHELTNGTSDEDTCELINKSDPSSNISLHRKSTLPVAKLIPVLCGIIFPILSPTPGQLLQIMLHSHNLAKFNYNIYEAFSG